MSWLWKFITSSIGKKLLMAATGLCFIGFLVTHLAGNLTMYGGAESFNEYAHKLHSLEPFLYVIEFGLLGLGLIHAGTGLFLFYLNFKARPQGYAVKKGSGGQTLSSRLMPYTGILILAFLVVHLSSFTFADKTGTDIAEIVDKAFGNPAYVGFYLFSMLVLFFHVRHGFWSAFQTVGANHPKYMPAVEAGSVLVAIVFAAGFASLPIFVYWAGLS